VFSKNIPVRPKFSKQILCAKNKKEKLIATMNKKPRFKKKKILQESRNMAYVQILTPQSSN